MHSFQDYLKDISSLRIQGAINVAKASVKAIGILAYESQHKPSFLSLLEKGRDALFASRSTEPAMRNSLYYILSHLNQEDDPYKILKQRIAFVNSHFSSSREKTDLYGSRKVIHKGVIFTHCHSSTVTSLLIKAKQDGKEFIVHNTETRPLYQGRLTAKELARKGIPVKYYVDSAARLALQKADIMFIGADAITSEGVVYNKIGSGLFAEIADKYDIPLYVCSDSWKFDPLSVYGFDEEIEKRDGKEVWMNPPPGIEVQNEAFEKIDSNLIAGIISELGVYKPEIFIEEVRRTYPWMI